MNNLIRTLLDQSSSQTCVARSDGGALHRNEHWYWLHTGGRSIQSVIDIGHPSCPVLPYQQAMLAVLSLTGTLPQTVLNLGFGGGAFERCFAEFIPQLQWQAVDNDAGLVDLVKVHLPLPRDWPVDIADASLYLADNPGYSADLILCDLFCGENHADCLEQGDFYRDAAAALTGEGVMAVNLAPLSEAGLVKIIAHARKCFRATLLAQLPPYGNVILLLGKSQLQAQSVLQHNAARWSARCPVDVSDWLQHFKRFE